MSSTGDEDDLPPEYHASLRVWSETLTAAEITRRLGDPTDSHERGTRRSARAAPAKEARWGLSSGVERWNRLDEHLEALLAFLDTRREEIGALRADCEIDIFCAVHANDDINCSFVFEPDLTRRLAEWELPLIVCCF